VIHKIRTLLPVWVYLEQNGNIFKWSGASRPSAAQPALGLPKFVLEFGVMPNSAKDAAEKQLDRILSFFPRVEAKGSFLFALDTGLLALVALNLHLDDFRVWFLVLPAVAVLLITGASLYFLYRCSFPWLKGGANSLIYFREIAKRTETKFIDEYIAQNDDAHIRDLLGQVWRNSEILKMKYDAIKIAFILSATALLPWTIFLALAAVVHSDGLVFK
jgi:hypothetical protein